MIFLKEQFFHKIIKTNKFAEFAIIVVDLFYLVVNARKKMLYYAKIAFCFNKEMNVIYVRTISEMYMSQKVDIVIIYIPTVAHI